ncbi:MAG TPA: TonB-dependent receptor [Saprospiraceae bacterium]|nr:TonB-dependent receptor [Saprospiraceae bacterium]HPI06463.1 TonB-dependent receptor [Saprospiraceae bacterium]
MKNLFVLLAGLFLYTPSLFSQTALTGMVTNEKEELLIGASVYWKDTRQGTSTDTSGHFSLPSRTVESTLVVNYIGYTPAEVQVLPGENNLWVEVSGIQALQQVTVSGKQFDSHVSTLETRNVEHISKKELGKAPCCNLSESFETNGGVDVNYANALTGVKEIQMLGLRGVYSQFMVENRPTMNGIATPFAFEYIPGTWLDGIQLAKGASSVKNGYAGIAGQINVELVKPHLDKPLFVNAFGSSEGRGELNVHLNKKGKGRISNGLLMHGSFVKNRWDMNGDNFYDSPSRHQLNGLYRVFYESPGVCAQFNVQALTDRRQGGQISMLPGQNRLFSIDQNNDRVEVWGKIGYEGIGGKPYNQIGNMFSASWHRSSALFGPNNYAATQKSFYWQSLYQTIIGTTDHSLVLAPSLQYDDVQETVNEGDLSRKEAVPGAMVEYTYSRPNLAMEMPDFVIVLGARADWNSRFDRLLFTPRMSAKYNFSPKSIVRVSAGRGFRSPNLMAENISLLAGNRTLHFANDLALEEAWNYGANFTQGFKLAKREASFSLDVYRTDFVQQILADVDQSPTQVFFYNVNGKSFSNSVLATLSYNLLPGLDVKLVYKWNDVRATYSDEVLRKIPLVAKHRGLVSIDYTTPDKKWMFNTRVQIVGPQRLPDNSQVPHEFVHDFPAITPTFAIWNAQVTRRIGKKLEIYAGGENLNGYQQHNAIIAANEPDSPYFNGSQIWAPMMRQLGYVGLRFSPAGI